MNNLELDSRWRVVRRDGAELRLGPTPFRIITLLARVPDGISHEGLYERTYSDRDDGGPGDDCFHVTISMLRKQLRLLGFTIPKCNRWLSIYELREISSDE